LDEAIILAQKELGAGEYYIEGNNDQRLIRVVFSGADFSEELAERVAVLLEDFWNSKERGLDSDL
jgi:hypothetical protein